MTLLFRVVHETVNRRKSKAHGIKTKKKGRQSAAHSMTMNERKSKEHGIKAKKRTDNLLPRVPADAWFINAGLRAWS